MSTLPDRRIKLTYRHYLLFPDDGKRHEIIEGEHFMSPSPFTGHQRISGKLLYLFMRHLGKRGRGMVLAAPMDVVLSDINVVQPDLIYVSKANMRIVTEKNIRGAPDLLIEILSPGTKDRDLSLKKDLYARFRVKEYWVVDPASRTISAFRLGKRGYGRSRRYFRKDHVPVAAIPGLILEAKEIFV